MLNFAHILSFGMEYPNFLILKMPNNNKVIPAFCVSAISFNLGNTNKIYRNLWEATDVLSLYVQMLLQEILDCSELTLYLSISIIKYSATRMILVD